MPTPRPHVVIVGAGFGGLAAAIGLLRAGTAEVTVLERGDDVGGVWRENTYPGAGCDVPSPLYSFSFETNPHWPRRYSLQPDIIDYLRRTARKYGVYDRIRFGTEVQSAAFADDRWTITTTDGATISADVLVPALGQLSRPALPDIPGRDSFAGPAFHSAHWRHDLDLAGKRVAVIGTGASAVQFVPRIQPSVASLTLFQRTAPYVLPKPDRAYTRLHTAAFEHLPGVQRAGRLGTWLLGEAMTYGITRGGPPRALMRALCAANLRLAVRDPALRDRLRPDHVLGCKRILFSNDYLPALTRPNVEVITEAISEITPTGVRTADGVEHDVDVIVYGTGFAATDFLAPLRITGTDGRSLDDAWADGAHAYLGMTVPGFPNMLIMYGPNTNLGGNSIVSMLEPQARHLRGLVEQVAAGQVVDVRADVAHAFDEEMQRRLAGGVWTQCASWYRTATGRVTTNWPGLVREYHRRAGHFDRTDYACTPARQKASQTWLSTTTS